MSNNKNFIEFVKNFRKKNPDLSYREAQKKAKIDYRKMKEKEQYNILKKEIKKDNPSKQKNKNVGRNYNQTQRNRTIININMNPNGIPSISTNQPVKTNVVNPLQPPIITQQQPIQSNFNISNPLKQPITKAKSYPEVKTKATNIGAPIGASYNEPKKEIETKKLNINTDFKSKLESLFKR